MNSAHPRIRWSANMDLDGEPVPTTNISGNFVFENMATYM